MDHTSLATSGEGDATIHFPINLSTIFMYDKTFSTTSRADILVDQPSSCDDEAWVTRPTIDVVRSPTEQESWTGRGCE